MTNHALNQKILHVDQITALKFKSPEAHEIWRDWKEEILYNDYGQETINYARRWGKYMQYLIENKKQHLSMIAYQTSLDCDIDECICEEEYSSALEILIQCWKYGNSLAIYASKY